MTPAERAYRLALLAYPVDYRNERGLEILTTILDGGEGRWPRRRELFAIVAGGVERRGLRAGGGMRAGSLRAGVRLAVFVWLFPLAVVYSCWALYPSIGSSSISGGPEAWRAACEALLMLLPVLALTRGWWFGPLAVACASLALNTVGIPRAATWPWEHSGHVWGDSALLALGFVPGIACALARPRADEPADRRSVLWVPGAVALGALLAWQGLFFSSWLGRPIALALVAGVVLARRDPRLGAAAATVALLAVVGRFAQPDGYDPMWLGAGTLFTVPLLLLTLAALWRLRPAVA